MGRCGAREIRDFSTRDSWELRRPSKGTVIAEPRGAHALLSGSWLLRTLGSTAVAHLPSASPRSHSQGSETPWGQGLRSRARGRAGLPCQPGQVEEL